MEKFKPTNIIVIVGAASLFLGALNMPYGYYSYLKGIISLISIYGMIKSYKASFFMFIIFAIALLIFNPLFKYNINRGTWKILDLVFGAIFLYLSYAPKDYKD